MQTPKNEVTLTLTPDQLEALQWLVAVERTRFLAERNEKKFDEMTELLAAIKK